MKHESVHQALSGNPKGAGNNLGYWLGLWFGSGLLPKAPGTWGTLFALPFWGLLFWWSENILTRMVAVTLVSLVGIWACDQVILRLSEEDPKSAVIDEAAGFGLTLLIFKMNPVTLVLAFILFRFFDILKPWPIRIVDERIHGGLGVMLDDLIAGVFAALIMCLAMKVIGLPLEVISF